MKPTLMLTVETKDAQGRRLGRWRGPARSFTTAWLRVLYSRLINVSQGAPDTSGVSRSLYVAGTAGNPDFNAYWGAIIATKGIVVGSGNTAVTLADYALAAQILHGSGSGQLMYGAMSTLYDFTTAAKHYFRLIRTFTNQYTSSIIVKECGLYFEGSDAYTTTKIWCGIRDVLASPQTIPAFGSFTVTYEWYIEP